MFGLGRLFCWVPRRRSKQRNSSSNGAPEERGSKRRRRRQMRRHIHAKAGALAPVRTPTTDGGGSQGFSPLSDGRLSTAFSDSEYHDALEYHEDSFSSRGSLDDSRISSPTSSHGRDDGGLGQGQLVQGPHAQQQQQQGEQQPGAMARLAAWWEARKALSAGEAASPRQPAASHGPSWAGEAASMPHSPHRRSSLGSPSSPAAPPGEEVLEPEEDGKVGCISLFTAANVGLAHKRFLRLAKPKAGSSFRRKTQEEEAVSCAAAWEPAEGTTFMVRSHQYMRSKQKEPSGPCIYRLIGVDVYSFDFKLFHIAQHVQLPEAPVLGPAAQSLPRDQQLPPLLIVNLQLPLYPPSLFGSNDGPGHSLVYYFALPEGWEPSQVDNAAALALVQRFVHNKREFDGTATRDRLKLIPRIVNVAEWAEKGPLSGYEHRLLLNYNDKPLLTRPQHRYYTGPNYLEIDLDVHNYAYIARKAFHGFIHRLAPVVFENAFVVQGNRPEELPETILAAARVYRVDFTKARPFPAKSVDELGNGTGPQHDGEALRK